MNRTIAITSGKGGVGKTFAATCLASVIAESQGSVRYIDCDVEAPNAHLFLKPQNIRSQTQSLPCIEGMDPDKCTHCGLCAKNCYFNALIVGKTNAMAFPELCRWCGACQIVCPHDALLVGQRTIGTIYSGCSRNINLHWATLQPGAGGMTVRLIEQIRQTGGNGLTVLDSPPGTSCAVVHTIQDADIVVLVADPTRFGLHDLKLSVHLCRSMNIAPLVLINRTGIGDPAGLRQWCQSQHLPILAEIPDDRRIAELYSKGILAIDHLNDLRDLFSQAAQTLLDSSKRLSIQTDSRMGQFAKRDFFHAPTPQAPPPKKATQTVDAFEITVLSGKGGTGKTSLTACFAQLEKAVVADCDVDAADMHLLLEPQVIKSQDFIGGRSMSIDPHQCTACGQCLDRCRWRAITKINDTVTINEDDCEGCGACVLACPHNAIRIKPTTDGQWYWSSTRYHYMSHAVLEPGKENSGKLVTRVRQNAAAGTSASHAVVVLDGSPGTGCPVIASVGGTKAAVIVTEPTISGVHDLKRICELTEHFKVPAGIVINKADINPAMRDTIRRFAEVHAIALLGELPYDALFIQAQQQGKTVLEFEPECELSKTIKTIWNTIKTVYLSGKERSMKIAIPTANGQLCMHFGHCEQFAFVTVDPENKTVISTQMLTPPPHEPGVLPKWVAENGGNLVIAGGMGQRAQQLFNANQVQVLVGAPADSPEDLATAWLKGALQAGQNVCDH